MVRIKLLELTDASARYKYYPENSKEYGIVTLNRKSGERILEKTVEGYSLNYAAHAFRRMEEYQKKENFLKEDIVVWY